MSNERFDRVYKLYQRPRGRWSIAQIERWSRARDADLRLAACFSMQDFSEKPPRALLPIARRLLADADNDCRWQAAIFFDQIIPSDPEVVWRVIVKHGASTDEDMRACMGCLLLEDLLRHDFEEFFPRLSREISRRPLFVRTLRMCRYIGHRGREHRWKQLLAAHERGRSRAR